MKLQHGWLITSNLCVDVIIYHDGKVHGANMGHIWGRQDPGGPHVGPMDFAIWVYIVCTNAVLLTLWCFIGLDQFFYDFINIIIIIVYYMILLTHWGLN